MKKRVGFFRDFWCEGVKRLAQLLVIFGIKRGKVAVIN
jgi:hypothetical protein